MTAYFLMRRPLVYGYPVLCSNCHILSQAVRHSGESDVFPMLPDSVPPADRRGDFQGVGRRDTQSINRWCGCGAGAAAGLSGVCVQGQSALCLEKCC